MKQKSGRKDDKRNKKRKRKQKGDEKELQIGCDLLNKSERKSQE